MTIFRESANALNIVALGLVAGLVAFITFQSIGTDDPVAGGTGEPAVQQSQHDDLFGEPLAMP